VQRRRETVAGQLEPVGNGQRAAGANEIFSRAGAANRNILIRPGADTDDWRIANPASGLAKDTAGGRRRGEIAMEIQRDGPDGAMLQIADRNICFADPEWQDKKNLCIGDSGTALRQNL